METPEQTRLNKEADKKVKQVNVKEPKKRYKHFIPEINSEIFSNTKDIQKVRNKYLRDKSKQWFDI